jgi:hypothetical protein
VVVERNEWIAGENGIAKIILIELKWDLRSSFSKVTNDNWSN